DNAIVRSCQDHVQVFQELGDLDRNRVGHEDDILVSHLEIRRQEEVTRLAEADAVDDRNELSRELVDVNAQQLGEFARLEAIDENRTGISLHVNKAASLADGLGKINSPGIEVDFALLARCSKRQELLLLPVDVDVVTRLHVNIVGRLIHQVCKRHSRAPSA